MSLIWLVVGRCLTRWELRSMILVVLLYASSCGPAVDDGALAVWMPPPSQRKCSEYAEASLADHTPCKLRTPNALASNGVVHATPAVSSATLPAIPRVSQERGNGPD